MKKIVLKGILLLSMISGAATATNRVMTVEHLQNSNSYFQIQIEDDGLMKGTYPGWCADWTGVIQDNTPYDVKFYSSLSPNFPSGLLDHPEYLDEMNWILNQHFVGKNAGSGLGVYTSGDVQLAIWTLLNDTYDSSTVGPFSQDRVDMIVNMALQYGSDFAPTCKQIVGMIFDPGIPQSTIIEIQRSHFYKCAVPEGDID